MKQTHTHEINFTQDKEYDFISYSESFTLIKTEKYTNHDGEIVSGRVDRYKVRWEMHNYRNFSNYDKPMTESKKGKYVRANYHLELTCSEIATMNMTPTIQEGDEYYRNCNTLIEYDREATFETKKEIKAHLNNLMNEMKNGKDCFQNKYEKYTLIIK